MALEDMLEDPQGHCIIRHCGRLEVQGFCDAVQAFFERRREFCRENFDHALLKFEDGRVCYRDISAGAVVFCEGMGVRENPWFNHLPFIPVAGDILEVSIPGLSRQRILKNGYWLVPVDGSGEDLFLAGSNYHAGSESREPVEADAREILEQLRSWIRADIRLIAHRRGLRPTVQRRRPYLGRHPEQEGLYIFNGFGSKGVSLCSWLAGEMTEFLLRGKALPAEVGLEP
jgi:glycine/D-amino acid oxidase-like deaminating enzyme